ncbi:MAG: hypothetical protein MK135_15905 [Polyangiaceae bacterium]|nr:hypothetical protein [Polyangiaceae bacterium]
MSIPVHLEQSDYAAPDIALGKLVDCNQPEPTPPPLSAFNETRRKFRQIYWPRNWVIRSSNRGQKWPTRSAIRQKRNSFTAGEWTHAVAYSYRFGEGWNGKWEEKDCDGEVLSQRGQLCETVNQHQVELPRHWLQKLFSLIPKENSKTGARCLFNPHHAIVFYDDHGRPLTNIRICFDCGQWSLGDLAPRQIEKALPMLTELCQSGVFLGCPELPPSTQERPALEKGMRHQCSQPPLDSNVELRCEEAEELYHEAMMDWEESAWDDYNQWISEQPAPRPEAIVGISGDRLQSELTVHERRLLCIARGASNRIAQKTKELDDDSWLRELSLDECIEKFPRCQRSLDSIPTLFPYQSQKFQDCILSQPIESALDCQWGFSWTKDKPTQLRE